jgi:hypothetical protein
LRHPLGPTAAWSMALLGRASRRSQSARKPPKICQARGHSIRFTRCTEGGTVGLPQRDGWGSVEPMATQPEQHPSSSEGSRGTAAGQAVDVPETEPGHGPPRPVACRAVAGTPCGRLRSTVAAARASSLQADPAGVHAPLAPPPPPSWSPRRIARPRRRRADRGAAASTTKAAAERPGRNPFILHPAVIAAEAAARSASAVDTRHHRRRGGLDRPLAAAVEQPALLADGSRRGQTADPG